MAENEENASYSKGKKVTIFYFVRGTLLKITTSQNFYEHKLKTAPFDGDQENLLNQYRGSMTSKLERRSRLNN